MVAILAGVAILFLWIPVDVESGVIEKLRRHYAIGDALAPSVAACVILLSGIWMLIERGSTGALKFENFGWIVALALIVLVALTIMRWLGPWVVALSGEEATYRQLRDTVPWKYLGFLCGGTVLVAGLIGCVERKTSVGRVALAFLIVLGIALAYDLPFEDLLLPPNGDV